jgi:putative endonuclease
VFFVYLLKSKAFPGQFYVGSTNKLKRRLIEHNEGKHKSTRRYRPWMIAYIEGYTLENSARAREQKLKHHGNAMKEVKKRIGLMPSKMSLRGKSGAGFTLTETLLIGALFGVLILAGTMVLGAERGRTRDMKLIVDMTRLSAGFALLYSQKATYADAAAGCPAVGALATACTLTDVLSSLNGITDPGRYTYSVVRVPDRDDFGIKFRLERTYGTLKAGEHILSKTGIR